MNAKSGNGSSGSFIWGVLVGLVVILGAGGAYLSGFFGSGDQTEQVAVVPEAPVAEPEPEEEATKREEQSVETETETVGAPPADAADEEAAEANTESASDTVAQDAQDEDPATETAAAPTSPPVLDQIFVSNDGSALLSGEAVPGSEVEVLLNGSPVHRFTVDETGQFAEFVPVPYSNDPQGLVLQTKDGSDTTRSDDYVIAALPEPAQVEPEETAEAETAENVESDTRVADEETPVASSDALAGSKPEEIESAEFEVTPQEPAVDAEVTSEDPIAEAEDNTPEDKQIAILRSGEDGVELVQSPSVESAAPEQVELDTIGYSDTGDVQLTGRVAEGSAVRLYLDNRLVAELNPEEDGDWRGELEGIDPGVYSLRVDEVATDGTVLSRIETPFKRETVEVLQAANDQGSREAATEAPAPIRSVTVQAGDTLWAISRERFGDGVLYVRLFEANRALIRDPDLIYPGQIFTIPE